MFFKNDVLKKQAAHLRQLHRLWNKEMPWLWAVCNVIGPPVQVTITRLQNSNALTKGITGKRYVHAVGDDMEVVFAVQNATTLLDMISEFYQMYAPGWVIVHLVEVDDRKHVEIYTPHTSVRSFLNVLE